MPIISTGLRYTNISCIADQPHVIKTNYKDRIPVAAPTPLFYRERNGPSPDSRSLLLQNLFPAIRRYRQCVAPVLSACVPRRIALITYRPDMIARLISRPRWLVLDRRHGAFRGWKFIGNLGWLLAISPMVAQPTNVSWLTSASDAYAIQTWRTDDGLPQNKITALLQTQRGYLWVGTYNGIAQFDGLQFRVFNASNTRGLDNSQITSLYESPDGTIWIGHESGAVSRYNGETFSAVASPSNWSRAPIQDFITDERGQVWALNQPGAAQRIQDGLIIQPTTAMGENPFVAPHTIHNELHEAFVLRNGVLARLSSSGYQPINFGDPAEHPYYAGVTRSRRGGWWVVGEGQLRQWNGQTWTTNYGDLSWLNASVTAMHETASGKLLIGTLQRGLFIFDPGTTHWSRLDRTHGLPQDWICSLIEDREQNLWVGTAGGLAVLRQRKVRMQSPPDNWEGRPVHAITQARDGSVWAASEGAGIYRLHTNQWTHFTLENQYAWAVLADSQNQIWAGTWGGGLFRLEHDAFVAQTNLISPAIPVTALAEFPSGTLWLGTGNGLARMRQGRLEWLASLGGAAAGDVRAIEPGPDGAIWIGAQGAGLGRLKDDHWETFQAAEGFPAKFVLALYADTDGTLWIGTLDDGLGGYRDGRFSIINRSQGLPANTIFHIADDHAGHLWFNSLAGLFRLDKEQLLECAAGRRNNVSALALGLTEGLSTLTGTGGFTPSGFRSTEGQLWFPTTRGMATISPASIHSDPVPPAVWIEDVSIDDQLTTPTAPKKSFQLGGKAAVAARQLVVVPPGRRQLDVQYTGLSFIAPERVQFKYRLDGSGVEADWVPAHTRRRVTFSFLPPGEYVFRVAARNGDGLWNEAGDTLAIRVLPFFWQTWWFKVLLFSATAVILVAVVFLESRGRLRRRLERMARERELERERSRIAQDIHDDLGASLTRIGMLSQSAVDDMPDAARATSSLHQIYQTARDLTRAMDEIVWAVNPRHDTLDSLINYVARFAHDFLSAAQIRCRLDTPLQTPEVTVRSEIRHNLFLAFKEALNNAVKHSGATEVRVKLELPPDGLRLAIMDNGAGLASVKHPSNRDRVSSGYGLAGIQSRLQQINGHAQIHSPPGGGTTVELYVPLAHAATTRLDK